jgi:hypothetical protein
MMKEFSLRASQDLERDPVNLFHWHQLATAGIEDLNPILIHHGLIGSLAFGYQHPVTTSLVARAIQILPRDSSWMFLLLKSISSLDPAVFRALSPIWLQSGLLEHKPHFLGFDQQNITADAVPKRYVTDDLEQAIGTIVLFSIMEPAMPEGSMFIHGLIDAVFGHPTFHDGSTHALTIQAHLTLVYLQDRYKFDLGCKAFVPDSQIDSLSIYRHYLSQSCFTEPIDSHNWISRHMHSLDLSYQNNYVCSFLLASCILALRHESPEQRIKALKEVSIDDILLFNATPLVARFFLHAAPPSLAAEFLAKVQSNPTQVAKLSSFHSNSTLVADYLSSSEQIFYWRSRGASFTDLETDDWNRFLPGFQGISFSRLADARNAYISGESFAVATFGQVRQNSFNTFSDNLNYYEAEYGHRFSYCAVSSWEKTAVARYPKTTDELLQLMSQSEVKPLIREAVEEIGLDNLYHLLLDYHQIASEPLDLKVAISNLSPRLDHLMINELIENHAEIEFMRLYPVTQEHQIPEVQLKILLNQFKMWTAISSSLNAYIDSGSVDPLLLHRADVPCRQIIKYIDSTKLLQKVRVTFLCDYDLGAIAVPPIGGIGDRFWMLSHEAAVVVQSILKDLHTSPLVNFLEPWPTGIEIPPAIKSTLMQHHRLCDYIFSLFSPSIYTIPVGHAMIERPTLFDITPDDFKALLARLS